MPASSLMSCHQQTTYPYSQTIMRQLTRWSSSLAAVLGFFALAGCTRPAPPPVKPPRFDQGRAYHRLQELCALGPRNHGSEGKKKAELLIQQLLREAGAEVSLHEFQYTPKGSTDSLSFRNIVGRIKPN